MKYKKTIRRSVQEKTATKARRRIRGYTIANRLNRRAAESRNPAEINRQQFLSGLTNWQHNQLLRRVKGTLQKRTAAELAVIVSELKKAS